MPPRQSPVREIDGARSYDKIYVYGRAAGRCCFRQCGANLAESYDDTSVDGSGSSVHLYAFDDARPIAPLEPARLERAADLVLLCRHCYRRACDPRNAVTADDLRGYRAQHEANVALLLSTPEP